MPAPKLKIVRIPLDTPIPDIKPRFASDIGDLHLEMLENKLKLKKGLPLIPTRTILKSKSPPKVVKPSPAKPQPKIVKKSEAPHRTSSPSRRDSDIITALGASDSDAGAGVGHKSSKPTDIEFIDIEDAPPSKGSPANKSPSTSLRDSAKSRNDDVPKSSPQKDVTPPQEDVRESDIERIHSDGEKPTEDATEPVEETPEVVEETTGEPEKSPEEIEEEIREEFVVKLRILKKQHPDYEFPPYSPDHTDAKTLRKIYKQAYRELSLDENVEWYEMFLGAAFIGIGMLGVKMKLPFEDFASNQMKKIKKYRKLLFELGEKSYVNFMESWPVEVRLLGMVIMDAALFWLAKVGIDFLGPGAGDMVSMITGVSSEPKKSAARMRGPKTKPQDIKNMASKYD